MRTIQELNPPVNLCKCGCYLHHHFGDGERLPCRNHRLCKNYERMSKSQYASYIQKNPMAASTEKPKQKTVKKTSKATSGTIQVVKKGEARPKDTLYSDGHGHFLINGKYVKAPAK